MGTQVAPTCQGQGAPSSQEKFRAGGGRGQEAQTPGGEAPVGTQQGRPSPASGPGSQGRPQGGPASNRGARSRVPPPGRPSSQGPGGAAGGAEPPPYAWGPTAKEGEGAPRTEQQPQNAATAAQLSEHQRDLLNRLYSSLPAGSQGPDLLKELAGSLGIPATQEPAQELQAARPAQEGELQETSGPKKMFKHIKIKPQGPYARPGEATPGAGTRSASAQGAQVDESTGQAADRGTEGGDAEQL